MLISWIVLLAVRGAGLTGRGHIIEKNIEAFILYVQIWYAYGFNQRWTVMGSLDGALESVQMGHVMDEAMT